MEVENNLFLSLFYLYVQLDDTPFIVGRIVRCDSSLFKILKSEPRVCRFKLLFKDVRQVRLCSAEESGVSLRGLRSSFERNK